MKIKGRQIFLCVQYGYRYIRFLSLPATRRQSLVSCWISSGSHCDILMSLSQNPIWCQVHKLLKNLILKLMKKIMKLFLVCENHISLFDRIIIKNRFFKSSMIYFVLVPFLVFQQNTAILGRIGGGGVR